MKYILWIFRIKVMSRSFNVIHKKELQIEASAAMQRLFFCS